MIPLECLLAAAVVILVIHAVWLHAKFQKHVYANNIDYVSIMNRFDKLSEK